MTSALIQDLQARGLIHNSTDIDELAKVLDSGPQRLYLGVDPTASSMHIGNLVGLVTLRRFIEAGHEAIALAGGSTGMVGDPSGRSDERNLLDSDTLQQNLAGIKAQFTSILGDGVIMVNNYDWTAPVGVLDFLRDVGKHVTVNQMLARDSVKSRIESENGISFTEFSYMLLQAFDFWFLYTDLDCVMQVGGSDQWGNIVSGIDLIRRREQGHAHGLTWPLVTRSDGAKFGKTAEGSVWLDPELTLPYEFHQYFLRVDDRDVEHYLNIFTLVEIDEIKQIMQSHLQDPSQRIAQRRLADEVTAFVHGRAEVKKANLAAKALFGREALDAESAEALRGIVAETSISKDAMQGEGGLVELLVASGLCTSKSDARRKLKENQISVNGTKTASENITPSDFLEGRIMVLQRGKKARHLVTVL